MKTRFLTTISAFARNRTLILLFFSFLIIIPSIYEVGGPRFNGIILFAGLALLFYTLLHPWEEKSYLYYISLMGFSSIIFILTFIVGIGNSDLFMKIFSHGHQAENAAWTAGLILIDPFIAGLVGLVL
jgi:hypothetical protein